MITPLRPLTIGFLLLALLMIVGGCAQEQTTVEIYDVKYDVRDNGMVSGTVNGQPIPFEYQHTFSDTYTPDRDHKGNYARLAADGPVDVELTVDAQITKATLHSVRRELPFSRDGSEFEFTLPGPGHYLLTLPDLYVPHDQTYSVHIFIDSLSTYRGYQAEFDEATDVTEHGVVSNPQKNQTETIQSLLGNRDAVYFPKGIYRTDQLNITNSTTLLLGEGAVLKGTDDFNHDQYLYIDDADSVRIGGLGTIDVNGLTTVNRNTKVHGIDWDNGSRHQVVEDIVFRDSKSWMLQASKAWDVHMDNLKIFSGKDGVDPDGVVNMVVENSTIVSIDDGLAVKSRHEGYYTENVVMRDNIVQSSASNLKIGTENYYGGIEDVVWDNNKVLNGDRGGILYTNEDGTVDVHNVTWRNLYIDNFPWNNRGEGDPFQLLHATGDPDDYTMSDIRYENIRAWPESDGVIEEPVSATFNNIIMNGRHELPPSENVTYEGVIWDEVEGQDIPVVFIEPSPRAHSRYVAGDSVRFDVRHPSDTAIEEVVLEISDDPVAAADTAGASMSYTTVGVDTESPFSIQLDDLSLGKHVLRAKATDVEGGTNRSAPLRIKVVESTTYFNAASEQVNAEQ